MERISFEFRVFSAILAAGQGERFQNNVKILHNINGKPMLQHVIDVVKSINFEKNFLVVNPLWNKINPYFIIPENFTILINNEYKKGISTSLKLLIKNIIHFEPDYIAIFLADMPYISTDIVFSILQKIEKEDKIIAPYYKNIKGFPTIVHKSLFQEILNLKGDKGIKQIIYKNPNLVKKIEFKTDKVIKDIDQP
ncbi:molybdenum cofactor cytidylyltransferase [Thermosipho japonicus]|uniref:Molybdenum cofactor cytidylyltransferase n=1 Tax=Thermosipho japonicus TaxID=90323 RepID=A0A841GHX5_9BACT|nr:nucleotidyltransferase family protein [Thermosipho japonicus]MBB6061967.1 molybdenum cofactor cytidylyltransferase [Thermosipho japonicus]